MPLSKLMYYTLKVCIIHESTLYFRFFNFNLFGCAVSRLWHAGSLGRVCGIQFPAVHCCSVAKSCPTPCDPMNCSMPGFPVLHYLPEFAQTHVHWICDAIQPSHPLSSPSPLALNLSQHQSLFQGGGSASGGQSIGVSASASVLPVNIQSWFPLGLTGLIFLLSKGLSSLL